MLLGKRAGFCTVGSESLVVCTAGNGSPYSPAATVAAAPRAIAWS